MNALAAELVAFLRARWDEAEATASAAAVRPIVASSSMYGTPGDRKPRQADAFGVIWYRHDDGWNGSDRGTFEAGEAHFAMFDPAYVLADIAAKRRIVDMYERAVRVEAGETDARLRPFWTEERAAFQRAVEALATAYATHPDYRPEWVA
ncbi:DUF6221 family protein [Jiangella muralis]|uniref:DUF6221 family protein n=1 Tax=Jiangella muralis TaxID=702383 RepID=UPI00069E4821|nr:DUF6221 family protein [Jiangella muralis]